MSLKKIMIPRQIFAYILIFAVLFLAPIIGADTEIECPPFQQYLWAGANAYAIYNAEEHERLQILDAIQRAQLSTLRIFLTYDFEGPIGTYHRQQVEKVDKLMVECLERGIKLVIAFETQLDGIYVRTYGPVDMYKAENAITAYKQRISYFLNHRNPYLNNTPWKDLNEVIFAWEIQNEPGTPLLDHMLSKYHDEAMQKGSRYKTSLEEAFAMNSEEKHNLMRNYLNQIASHIKDVDPDTYVALGTAGDSNYYHENGGRGDDLRTLGNIPDADIYTLHFYGGRLDVWLDDHIDYVRGMGKLLLIEEFIYEGEEITDAEKYDFFQTVTRICRLVGIPWIFWQFGLVPEGSHPKWYLKGNIREDTPIWQEIILPEARSISTRKTDDKWYVRQSNVHPSKALAKLPVPHVQ